MPSGCVPAETDAVRTLGFAAIGGAYAVIGAEFGHTVRMMRLVNLTDGGLMFTDDRTVDKWPVPAGSFVLYDYAANSKPAEGNLALAEGTQIYVRNVSAITLGAAYVECTYAKGQ